MIAKESKQLFLSKKTVKYISLKDPSKNCDHTYKTYLFGFKLRDISNNREEWCIEVEKCSHFQYSQSVLYGGLSGPKQLFQGIIAAKNLEEIINMFFEDGNSVEYIDLDQENYYSKDPYR